MKHMSDNPGLNTGILKAVTQRVRLVEHEVLAISEHMSLLWRSCCSILVLLCSVLWIIACFFRSLYCLLFSGLRLMITPLLSSDFSHIYISGIKRISKEEFQCVPFSVFWMKPFIYILVTLYSSI